MGPATHRRVAAVAPRKRTGGATSRRTVITLSIAALAAAALGACGSPDKAASGSANGPVNVGIVYSQTGPLASYGQEYVEGFKAGLAYATNNTGKVNGQTINATYADDAGDPATAVSAAKGLIGKGYKILAGSTSSGVALQVAPLAAQNKVLFIDGPAATDAITGINKYTFRSGRQSYQDVLTAQSFIGAPAGKKVVVFAQDSAFGQANVAAVKAVIGGGGATVTNIAVPATATDFTPFARQARNAKADLLFVAWAGANATAMWQALDQQGVLSSTTVVTGLDIRASWPALGAAGSKVSFLAHYFDGASDEASGPGRRDRFVPPGWIRSGPDDRARDPGELGQRRLDDQGSRGLPVRLGARPADHSTAGPRAFAAAVPGEADRIGQRHHRAADQDGSVHRHRAAGRSDEELMR
jgi:branched-chain amino acid transport system substrate-binding protein